MLKRQTQVMKSKCEAHGKKTRRKPPEENYSSDVHGKISFCLAEL